MSEINETRKTINEYMTEFDSIKTKRSPWLQAIITILSIVLAFGVLAGNDIDKSVNDALFLIFMLVLLTDWMIESQNRRINQRIDILRKVLAGKTT